MAKDKTSDVGIDDEDMTVFEFSEDISQAEQPDPLPEGSYSASIEQAVGKVSQSGKKYAAVTFMIPPEQFPADYPVENAPDGKKLTYRRVPLEDDKQSHFRLRQFCEAIGVPVTKQLDLKQMVGMTATVHIKHGEWEGVTREEVDRVEAG